MPSQKLPFHVAIVGGGIGGLCAALSIHHHCPKDGSVVIDVYEQAPEYKEIGAGLGIGVNAAKLLHRIGVGEDLNKISGHRNGIWISFRRYDTGSEIVTVPVDDQQEIRQSPVHRAEFLTLLFDHVKKRNAATLHVNKKCIELKDQGNFVELCFADGSTTTADLVVGCDGIHSNIRSQFRSDNPKYSGRMCYRGLVPIKDLESWWPFPSYSISWLGPDKHFLAFPISRNTILNIVAFVYSDDDRTKESWTATGHRSEVQKEFESFDATVRKTISFMNEHPSKWILNDRDLLDQWVYGNGKIVLMGDAAHAMLPHQGAGAGQAIEDGYILGRAISDYLSTSSESDTQSLEKWMQLYQDVRLPRAQKAQETARQAGQVYEMQTPEMKGKSYEDCLPLVRDSLKDRMQWIWAGDIEAEYEAKRQRLMDQEAGANCRDSSGSKIDSVTERAVLARKPRCWGGQVGACWRPVRREKEDEAWSRHALVFHGPIQFFTGQLCQSAHRVPFAPRTTSTVTGIEEKPRQTSSASDHKEGPRKRRRATVACRSCRQRKTKCDHIVPAQASDEMLRGMTKSAQVYIRSLERRVRNFEDVQRDANKYHQNQQQPQPAAQTISPVPSTSQYEATRMTPIQRPTRPSTWSSAHNQQLRPNVLPTTPDIFLSGKAGESFTQLILNAMNHPSVKLDSQSFSSPRDSSVDLRSSENLFSPPVNTREYLQVYFDFHHELTPIFHVPSIMAEFEQILSTRICSGNSHHVYILAILNMICALAAAHSRQRHGDSDTMSRKYYNTAMQLMQPNILSDWKIEKVQALLLGARYLQSSSYSDECWTVLGLAIRFAYDLELHRPPDPEQFDCIEQEVRKRVWYACFGLDKLFSMMYGRPAATSTATFSTPLPEDLDDDCIRPHRLLFPSVQTTSSMSFFLQVSKLYRILESTTLLGDQPTLADLVRLDEEFESWHAEIPNRLRIRDADLRGDERALILALRANMVCILIHRQSLVSGLSALSSIPSSTAVPAAKGWEGGRLRTSILQRSRQICVSTAEETVRLVAERHERTKNAMGPSWFNLYYLFTSILIIVSHVVDPDFQDDRTALMHLDQAVNMIRQMSVNHLCAQRAYAFLQQLLGLLDQTMPEDRRRSLDRCSTPPPAMTGSNRGTAEATMYSNCPTMGADEAMEDGAVDLWSLWDTTQDLTMDLGSQLELHSSLGSSTWSWGVDNPGAESLMQTPPALGGIPG
ncbi:FAD/NAD(P)-binding domain-containing protein [Trichoderma longibrachiatum]